MRAFGFREEILKELEELHFKVILAQVDEELIAFPETQIREIIHEPPAIPWIRRSPVVGVFMIRSSAVALTDPLFRGKARRIALLLAVKHRFIAVGVDRLEGVWEGSKERTRELPGARYPWVQEFLMLPHGPALLLESERYLRTLTVENL